MDRRTFVGTMCLGGLATFAWPSVSFARVPGRNRLVFVLLRGGVDGLAALVPYGDPAYRALRGPFAFDAGEVTPLDDVFGLAPGLAPLRDLWQQNELVAHPRHGHPVPHPQPLRRAGDSRDRVVHARPDPPTAG